ncbi:PF04134 family protein [Leptospira weilii serovar Ranarum str. ICFT]|uniref:PF04134 family protein n=1 Tax=Leptospira weilii serovar Ranarum str. ICFT TaxID=1218598 RepID=N1WP27_9LEPT|nr:DCC1-like thiol-disulfide oxidoreductase family protein [Leptospira weilii]EMY77563.1 PF04134 family protein [Leptospira weilii serovar Ranarum str. ICFT]
MEAYVFLYDGECSFCSKLAIKLQNLNLDPKIRFRSFRDFSEKELKEIHPTLNVSVLEGNVQMIANGRRYPGFFAVRKLGHSLKGVRWIAPLLYLPLIPIFGMIGMNLLKSLKSR